MSTTRHKALSILRLVNAHRGIVMGVMAVPMLAAVAAVLSPKMMPASIANSLNRSGLEGCFSWWYPTAHRDQCIVGEMLEQLKVRGSVAVLDFDRISMRHSKALGGECHVRMHDVGARYFERVGVTRENLPRLAPDSDDPNCAAGYLHALMLEAVDSGAVKDEAAIRAVCLSQSATRYRRKNCVHGVGHAFMRQTGSSLDRSLDMCKALGPPGVDCAPGVYHALSFSFMPSSEEIPSNVRASSPLDLCSRRVEPLSFVRACWVRMMSVPDFHISMTSVADARRECDALKGNQRRGCFTAAGWGMIGADVNPIGHLLKCAQLQGNDGIDCLYANSDVGPRSSIRGIRALLAQCPRFGTAREPACAQWFGYVGSFSRNRPLTSVCTSTKARLESACLAGTRRIDEPMGIF